MSQYPKRSVSNFHVTKSTININLQGGRLDECLVAGAARPLGAPHGRHPRPTRRCYHPERRWGQQRAGTHQGIRVSRWLQTAKLDPLLFLDCGGLEGGGRNERRDQILQLSVPEPQSFKPEGPNAYNFKFCHLATLPSGGPAVQETSDTQRVGQRALCSLGQLLCFRLGLPASQLTGPAAVASS